MTLAIGEAEKILRSRLGEPVKKQTEYIIGFQTPDGKLLAMHREANETRVWFQPPIPPTIAGIKLLEKSATGNSNLNGQLLPLKASDTLRVEVHSVEALHRFLDWYTASIPFTSASEPGVKQVGFSEAFARFQQLILVKSGHPFITFQDGLVASWESYKPRLRDYALGLLRFDEWSESDIGSGVILNCVIESIEIQAALGDRTNNLVFWQNRYGHANRDHHVLLEAATTPKLRREIEGQLYALYRGGADEGVIFDQLRDLTGAKYPLLAYLYFLKDMDRFMPIQPTGFDRAFRTLGIDFRTLRQCSWENYSKYNETLDSLRPHIGAAAKLDNVRLVDAHSFCWILSTLMTLEAEGSLSKEGGNKDDGRVLGAREKAIIEMRMSVENTVKNSNGQIVQRTVKNKELRMTSLELEKRIRALLDIQENRCALSGLAFQFQAPDADKNLFPSLDRKDSNGHYEDGNLQVVCQFINFWKSDSDNDEFKRLLMLVKGFEQ